MLHAGFLFHLVFQNEETAWHQHHWKSQSHRLKTVSQQRCRPQSKAMGERHISRAFLQQRGKCDGGVMYQGRVRVEQELYILSHDPKARPHS